MDNNEATQTSQPLESNTLARCLVDDGIGHITLDDGGQNVLSPAMLKAINQALDACEKANAVVILTGRENILSAGFDLKILKTGVNNAMAMLLGGFRLSRRLLSFPTPVIIANPGHAIAMGSFLLLSADYRIGTRGDFKIVANEVKIGLTMPHSAIAVCRDRLAPAHFQRATLLSEQYNPESAVAAGFLDEVVSADELMRSAEQKAIDYQALDSTAHRDSKLRIRKALLKQMSRAIRADRNAFIAMGLKRIFGR